MLCDDKSHLKEGKTQVGAGKSYLIDLRQLVHLFLFLWPYTRKYLGLFCTGSILSFLLTFFRLIQPWPLKWIFDGLKDSYFHIAGYTLSISWGIAWFSAAYLIIACLAALTQYIQEISLARLSSTSLSDFREDLLKSLLLQPLIFHENRKM